MPKREKPPAPIVRLEARGILPVTMGDAEEISALPNGTEFDLVKRSRRSHKHLRKYWAALGAAIKATGISPTREHLHNELKLATGYTQKMVNRATGEVHTIPDSIALDAMDQDDFNLFFETAMKMLASWVGYDPLRFMEDAA